jgi:GPI ethanolamine phosphate transferase 2/3 subunit F
MASTTTNDPIKPALPITLLDSDQAWLYAHIHPLFVLSTFILQFKAIINDPVTSLSMLILPLGIAQLLYAIICLPPVGSAAKTSASKPSNARKKATGSAATSKTSSVGIMGRIKVSPI